MSQFQEILKELGTLDVSRLYKNDFFLTWGKTDQEIAGVFAVADALRDLLRDESRKRERLKPGNFKEHIGRLSDEKVLAEAQRLSAAFQSLQAPNSPNGTHFVVEVSPWFERIASSKEHERLFALLPYKTLYLSSVKDRHGVFAFISKDERRDLPLRKQRPSVRAQLKEGQSKKTAAPKKAAAKAKDNDLEV